MSSINLSNNALSNSIAEHISQQILSGELKPGDKLVENNYAEEYGISRAPVREAIYLLATEGLVERIPRKGAVVKEFTKNEIYDLLEIRTMLETMAMKRIRQRGIDHFILQNMKNLLEEMNKVDGDNVHYYTKLNHSFHMCIIEMSKSETIKNMYLRLGMPLLRIQSLSFTNEGNIPKSVSEHKIIVDYLEKEKIEEADRILTKHNQDVVISIEKKLNL